MVNILLQLWRRLISLLRRGRYEREMEEEMRFHLEMQIEQNLASGMAAEEARYAARRQFGNQTWLKEASREIGNQADFDRRGDRPCRGPGPDAIPIRLTLRRRAR
ncbi:MAG TPA: permease prefix domain 1-containing protein [Blastocatellia bacterium]